MEELFGELVEMVIEGYREVGVILGGAPGALMGVLRLSTGRGDPSLRGIFGDALEPSPGAGLPSWELRGRLQSLPPNLRSLCSSKTTGALGGAEAAEQLFFRAVLGEDTEALRSLQEAPLRHGALGSRGVAVLLRRTPRLLSLVACTPFLEIRKGKQVILREVLLACSAPFACLHLRSCEALSSLRLASLVGEPSSLEEGELVELWAEDTAPLRALCEAVRPLFGGQRPPLDQGTPWEPLALWELGEGPPEITVSLRSEAETQRVLEHLEPFLGEMSLEWRAYVAYLRLRFHQRTSGEYSGDWIEGWLGERQVDFFPIAQVLLEKSLLAPFEMQSLFARHPERCMTAESQAFRELAARCLLQQVNERETWPARWSELLGSWEPDLASLGPQATLLLTRLGVQGAPGRLIALAGKHAALVPTLADVPRDLPADAVLALLEQPEPQCQAAAAVLLGSRGELAAIPSLQRLLSSTEGGLVRMAASYALGCLGCPPEPGQIEQLLSSSSMSQLGGALWAAFCPDPRFREPLLRCLTGHSSVGDVAFWALCQQPFSEALWGPLTGVLEGQDASRKWTHTSWGQWLFFASKSQQPEVAARVLALLPREASHLWPLDLVLAAARCTSERFPLATAAQLRSWSDGKAIHPAGDQAYQDALRWEALHALARLGEAPLPAGTVAPGAPVCSLSGFVVDEDGEPMELRPLLLHGPSRVALLFSGIDGSYRYTDFPYCNEYSLEWLE